jgi:hypothetical protein
VRSVMGNRVAHLSAEPKSGRGTPIAVREPSASRPRAVRECPYAGQPGQAIVEAADSKFEVRVRLARESSPRINPGPESRGPESRRVADRRVRTGESDRKVAGRRVGKLE